MKDAATAETLNHETRLQEDDHHSIKLWLRILTCSSLIERQLRSLLRERFATTLPRFDFLAQLERVPDGLTMGQLSQRMMVSGGNISGITTQLVNEGLVDRRPVPNNRRTFVVRLISKGRKVFRDMAAEHEDWVIDMLGHLKAAEVEQLMQLLNRIKSGINTDKV